MQNGAQEEHMVPEETAAPSLCDLANVVSTFDTSWLPPPFECVTDTDTSDEEGPNMDHGINYPKVQVDRVEIDDYAVKGKKTNNALYNSYWSGKRKRGGEKCHHTVAVVNQGVQTDSSYLQSLNDAIEDAADDAAIKHLREMLEENDVIKATPTQVTGSVQQPTDSGYNSVDHHEFKYMRLEEKMDSLEELTHNIEKEDSKGQE